MTIEYEFINPEDIPADLPPGEYTTKLIKTGWKEDKFIVTLEFRGEHNTATNRCLFPLVKRAPGWEPIYSDTYADDITDYHVWDSYRNLDEVEPISTGIE